MSDRTMTLTVTLKADGEMGSHTHIDGDIPIYEVGLMMGAALIAVRDAIASHIDAIRETFGQRAADEFTAGIAQMMSEPADERDTCKIVLVSADGSGSER